MLALLDNLGAAELLLIVVVAVLVFGQNLPQAASKAYLQLRKLRGAVDDLRRDSGIDRELRELERNVREAEWEARRRASLPPPGTAPAAPKTLPGTVVSAAPEQRAAPPSTPPDGENRADEPRAPTDAAS